MAGNGEGAISGVVKGGPQKLAIDLPREKIAEFCRKWQVVEFALFGSVLRPDDFGPDSDVDVMVTFEQGAPPNLADWLDMRDELERLFGRKVDLVSRHAVERSVNWYRRQSILESAEVVYGR